MDKFYWILLALVALCVAVNTRQSAQFNWIMFGSAVALFVLGRYVQPFTRLFNWYKKRQHLRALEQIVFTKQAFREEPLDVRGFLAFATDVDPHTLIVTRMPDDCPVPPAVNFTVFPTRYKDSEHDLLADFLCRRSDLWSVRFLRSDGMVRRFELRRGDGKDRAYLTAEMEAQFAVEGLLIAERKREGYAA